mgnify:FL=1
MRNEVFVNTNMWYIDNRYYKILTAAVTMVPMDVDIGCPRDDIGTHSHRKFIESRCAGMIDGPTHTQVYIYKESYLLTMFKYTDYTQLTLKI